MVLERLQQIAKHIAGDVPPHPFDPLSAAEIEAAVAIVRTEHADVRFNAVALQEPRKAVMQGWLVNQSNPRPPRIADVVCIGKEARVYDGLVDLDKKQIISFEHTEGVQPLITIEDLQVVEHIVRKDPKVIEQCGIIGIPPQDMDKVYCDPWTIGYDSRYGSDQRVQQCLMYYRPNVDDLQYSYPLDFCPIFSEERGIIDIDIPAIRRPLNRAAPNNYIPAAMEAESGYRDDLKPLHITQPKGVSFSVDGRYIKWQNWSFHVGFGYKEGIILNNIQYNDKGHVRDIFYRLAISEMVVPYANPDDHHWRKHALDLGEYGAGYMANSLSLGCDCVGSIKYFDADFVTSVGISQTIKNAICIHEEDAGLLHKHTDFRDDSVIVTRNRKLIISSSFTPANYDYWVGFSFELDGTITLEVKLTGILNTYAMNPNEDLQGYGTEVSQGVVAHAHQHLFSLRIDPAIDGNENTVTQCDAKPIEAPVGSPENRYGNAFRAIKTPFNTPKESIIDYGSSATRSWDIANRNKLNPVSKQPVSYKLISRETPPLLAKPGSLVWKRAGFARNSIQVVKYRDDQLYAAGRHPAQASGESPQGIPKWIEDNPDENIENTDIVVFHTFGITHSPAPEDYPIMPAEPLMVKLRPRHFFTKNPALDVPPSFCSIPSQVAAKKAAVDNTDTSSRLV